MISSIRLQNFRSYADRQFTFDDGVNVIVGPNASGKTNLLEAILALCSGSAFRDRDIELVKHGCDWARLDGLFDGQERVIKYQKASGLLHKTIDIEGKIYKRLSTDKTLPTVLFEPNDLMILIRGPQHRRDYFDDLIAKTTPGFKTLRNSYKRSVAQRNRLLKNGLASQGQLFVWDVRISELGGQIVAARLATIEQINNQASDIYSSVAGGQNKLELNYKPSVSLNNYSSALLKKLQASTELDYLRGFTAYGPHREDIEFILNDKQAEHSASRGETRSLMLSLKIYEQQLLETIYDKKPIILLDDVFSELDATRRKSLIKHFANHQTIITTTDADVVHEKNSTTITIKS